MIANLDVSALNILDSPSISGKQSRLFEKGKTKKENQPLQVVHSQRRGKMEKKGTRFPFLLHFTIRMELSKMEPKAVRKLPTFPDRGTLRE